MSAQLSPQPEFQAFAPNGQFLVGGKLFTYQAGTTTPQATYIDSTQTTQNTNPVILNAMGQASVWLNPGLTYKFLLQDSAGNQLWSQDNIQGALSTAVINVGVTSPVIPFGGGSVASFNGGPTSFGGNAVVIAGGTNANNVALGVVSRSFGEALVINGQNVTGQSLGMSVIAGTNASDVNTGWVAASGSPALATLRGDGAFIVGPAATAGEGPGTINVSGGYFINGVNIASSGTFTGTLAGGATGTALFNYVIVNGAIATIYCIAGLQGNSTTTGNPQITGLPAALTPLNSAACYTMLVDNSVGVTGVASVSGTTITLSKYPPAVFTAAGQKGINTSASFTYALI